MMRVLLHGVVWAVVAAALVGLAGTGWPPRWHLFWGFVLGTWTIAGSVGLELVRWGLRS